MARYAVAGVLLLAALAFPWIGAPWYFAYMIASVGVLFILGGRRILRAAISRPSADEVLCRFAPWYEGFMYGAFMMLPGMGIALLAASSDSHNPAWFRYGGSFLLIFAPMFLMLGLGGRRRAFLRFTPATLSIRDNVRGAPVTDIQRSEIESVTPVEDETQRLDTRQVAVSYREPTNNGLATKRLPVLFLTVEPDNLLHAVETWAAAPPDETPNALMDRIETILRGRPCAGPEHKHWARA